MKIFGFFVLFLLLVFAPAIFPFEIADLDESNFNSSISQQNFSLILFYTTYCSHSNDVLSNLTEVMNSFYSSTPALKFFKINAMKEKNLTQSLAVRGYPSIKVYDAQSQSYFDWKYDVTKSEMKYLVDTLLLKNLTHYSNVEKLRTNKDKFQLFFIGNITEDYDTFQKFKSYSDKSKYILYNFASAEPNSPVLNYFFIPESEVGNCSFILIRRRYDNFDKRLKITTEIKESFDRNFEDFFANYSHPFYIEHFNHRIRNFLIDYDLTAVGIFYRKKTKVYDSFISGLFRNMTRNYILELKYKEDNFLNSYFEPKRFVFTFLDTEDTMVRRLSFFMGLSEKDMPIIAAYQISKENKKVYSYVLNRQFQESPYSTIMHLVASTFHQKNRDHNFKSFYKAQNKSKDSKIYDLDPGVLGSFLKLYYPKSERTMHLIEYSATFCLHSKKVSVIVEKMAKNELKINGVHIFFGRMQLYGSDFANSGVEKVPVLRFYLDKERYVDVDVQTLTEKSILESLEKIIKKELESTISQKSDL